MHTPLHERVLALETILQNLRDDLTQNSLPDSAREALLAHIRFATDALDHYRRAIELENVESTSGQSKEGPDPSK